MTTETLSERTLMKEIPVTVEGQATRVFVGGRGDRLLLVHGGWGGASLHWSHVWERLAERFEVIAPDLPGIGRPDQKGLRSVAAYAWWLRGLLDALGAPSAWCVGNSFGASVACRFAGDYPERCRGLVLVNGIPMPHTPRLLRWLGERPLGHRLMRVIERQVAYTPTALKRGFYDPAHVPQALRDLVQDVPPAPLDAMVDAMVRGSASSPRLPAPLLLWGEDDHLPGTSARAARALHASWPGSTLALVPKAGHLPQVENPAAFVYALTAFVRAR